MATNDLWQQLVTTATLASIEALGQKPEGPFVDAVLAIMGARGKYRNVEEITAAAKAGARFLVALYGIPGSSGGSLPSGDSNPSRAESCSEGSARGKLSRPGHLSLVGKLS